MHRPSEKQRLDSKLHVKKRNAVALTFTELHESMTGEWTALAMQGMEHMAPTWVLHTRENC
jgi:hypothetical protein